MDECKEWLEDFLKTNPDGVKVKDVIEAGQERGLGRRMIFRARQELASHVVNTEGRKSPTNRWRWSDAPASFQVQDDADG